ncbi:uncharacterized protein LOC126771468 [Nymphalis io]|uniref:uncharacterized protein LOC126771468 n=1 Tax=Inachis io TaxID=171585 RepID=UPI002169FFA7|nr:uncharacterized protein LOC126771468 [Nymphalis io]
MLCLLLLVLVANEIRPAYVTDSPSFADRLDRLYEKLEKITVAPAKKFNDKLYAKLERLNSLTPAELSEDDEELLSAMQLWGSMSDDQLRGVVQEMQRMREDDKSERLNDEYSDGYWNDDDLEQDLGDGDYANDVGEEWDPLEEDSSSTSRPLLGVTPSAFTRLDVSRHTTLDPVAATNERPRILEDSHSTAEERVFLHKSAIANMRNVVHSGKCLTPQPRWLSVRKLAPAADTLYIPPCVQLHRCAPDSGCCYDESQVCTPVDGKYVALSFFLNRAGSNVTPARILFYNHTRCACVSKETQQNTPRTKIYHGDAKEIEMREEKNESASKERQNDWRAPTEEPRLERDEEQTSPPQLKRCTCPALFKNRIKDGICSCVCDWPEITRKRDCLSLARGKEHFGLRDRVCVSQGDCTTPTCEYGPYERSSGRCPYRRFKRRFHSRRYQRDKV